MEHLLYGKVHSPGPVSWAKWPAWAAAPLQFPHWQSSVVWVNQSSGWERVAQPLYLLFWISCWQQLRCTRSLPGPHCFLHPHRPGAVTFGA